MDLRAKLALLRERHGGTPAASPPSGAPLPSFVAPDEGAASGEDAERLESMRVQMRLIAERTRKRAVTSHEAAPLSTVTESTPVGEVHLLRRLWSSAHVQGRTALAEALEAAPPELATLALDPSLSERDVRRALFIDTETTGLHGGTGTLAFLVGLAWFEDDTLRLEQLFLPRPGAEAPLLHWLGERMRSASMWVSYNGKSFDLPLLATRFTMNRMQSPSRRPHVDLLHCARRVFKRRLTRLGLADIERQVLRFERPADVPGWQIPALYGAYLRHQDSATLSPVFEHNAQDLVSLAALMGSLCSSLRSGACDDPRDALGLAHVAARARDHERALRLASMAHAAEPTTAAAALALTARLLLRQGDPHKACAALEKALLGCSDTALQAQLHLQLAKLLEHRLGAPDRALAHARAALAAETPERNGRRCARLERRLRRRERSV